MTLCSRFAATIDGVTLELKDTCFMKGGALQKTVDLFDTVSSCIIEISNQAAKPNLRVKKSVDHSFEQAIIDHQKVLSKRVCSEALEKYKAIQGGSTLSTNSKSNNIVCYPNERGLPSLNSPSTVPITGDLYFRYFLIRKKRLSSFRLLEFLYRSTLSQSRLSTDWMKVIFLL